MSFETTVDISVCPICNKEPGSHSLSDLGIVGGSRVFYTCPANATKYNDLNGILNHYTNALSTIGEDTKWVWLFDSKGFNMTHVMEFQVGISLAKLITEKFSNNLEYIYISNPTWYIHVMHRIITPFLSKNVREKIVII